MRFGSDFPPEGGGSVPAIDGGLPDVFFHALLVFLIGYREIGWFVGPGSEATTYSRDPFGSFLESSPFPFSVCVPSNNQVNILGAASYGVVMAA